MANTDTDENLRSGDIVPLFCPDCGKWVTHIAVGAGPSLVRHYSSVKEGGRWRKCERMWVAIVSHNSDGVVLSIVERGEDPKAALLDALHTWLDGELQ